ncbi:hypothetical protein IWW39_004484 [Coemansia spiralis]|uniref:RNB domain-containing protein n=1 Tax=Coemansia spiralis TaxID=417178 RepID=A0A9W8L2M3_9FUNG|nr:hypothetical protein IWW39_004484 [Coemansia spiralis]
MPTDPTSAPLPSPSPSLHSNWRASRNNLVTPAKETKQQLTRLYEAYYEPNVVRRLIEAGQLVRGVVRLNPKNRADAYVSLDETPSHNARRLYPALLDYDVGGGDDIYLCGEASRNRAIFGDVVAVRILPKKAARNLYRENCAPNDRRMSRLREERKARLEAMADQVASESDTSALESNCSGGSASSERRIPEVFGTVVAILARNEDRCFTGTLSADLPMSVRKHTLFLRLLDNPVMWFKPINSALPFMTVPLRDIPTEVRRHKIKQHCTVRMGAWHSCDPLPSASFVRALDERGSIDAETTLILEENAVCYDPFTPNVLRCLPKLPWRIPERELRCRTDLRGDCIFTIDPPTARDLDDAVSCTPLPNGNVLIGVHIADVSFFVRPQTALDKQARQRATTTYMVQKAIPMLPSILCEDLCSLNPGVDRLAFSVMWEMDPESATVRSTWFGRTIINSACKLAYDDAQSVIEGNRLGSGIECFEFTNGSNKPASARRRTQIESSIRWFFKLSKVMRKRRFDSGALSLSSVKLSFNLDSLGAPVSCQPYAIKDSNRLIEEFMLLANMSVAARIEATFPDASLLRRHSPPLQRRLDETCQQLGNAGIDIVPGSARDIQHSLEQIEDPDIRFTVESLLTGPMQRAAYFSTHSIADRSGYQHYALNVPLYTHFTSPIRRYADIIVHRTLEASLAAFGNHVIGDHPLLPALYSPYFPRTLADGSLTVSGKDAQSLLIPNSKTIADIAHQCNLRKDAAKKAQDASSKLFLVNYLAQKAAQFDTPGVVSLAIVTKIKADGFVLTVPMFGIESLIYMDRLADKNSQVQSLDGRTWKLCLWSVDASSITLIWEASSHANDVDDLASNMSALIIDEGGQFAVNIPCAASQERFTQTLAIFDKMSVCVVPNLTPPDLLVKLAMPSIH